VKPRIYRDRNRIERMIGQLEVNRAVATRDDKLARPLLDALHLAAKRQRHFLGIRRLRHCSLDWPATAASSDTAVNMSTSSIARRELLDPTIIDRMVAADQLSVIQQVRDLVDALADHHVPVAEGK